jgi:hypothetical protein
MLLRFSAKKLIGAKAQQRTFEMYHFIRRVN